MTKPYDLETAKNRIRQVFRYLQEMHRVRTPPIVTLEEREWTLPLDSLPSSPFLQKGWGDADEGTAGDFVLKVGRPEPSACPEPTVVIKNWLKAGWDRPGVDPETFVKQTRKARGGGTQTLDDSEERADALEEWLALRSEWEAGARHENEALEVFSELFEQHSVFERESEKYQLFVGDGILVLEHEGQQIAHPVLLQRVELSFNPAAPEFVVRDTDDNPEIYMPLLRHVGLDGIAIQYIREAVDRDHFHPLAGESTSAFLRDFVQRHWKDGQYFETCEEADETSGPRLYRRPVLFLGDRNQGFSESIDRYLEALPLRKELPESLLRIVGIDTGRGEGAVDAPPVDILLTKHANLEQERVIRRLEETGAVLVQGPPGTGKSHTIANLVGHLLAQDKSILVTSHASKALRVVREKLAEPLQPLCVSVLQNDAESGKQLEESVTGIVNYLASTSEKKLESEIEKLVEKRTSLKEEYDDLRDRLLDAAKNEYVEIEVLGESVAPSEAARRLVEDVGRHAWIPGALNASDLPLWPAEVEELYALGVEVTADDDELLGAPLPDLDVFATPQDFAALYDEIATLDKRRRDPDADLWTGEARDPDGLTEFLETMRGAVELLGTDEDWLLECVEAGRVGGERKTAWEELVGLVERCAREVPEKEVLVVKHGPDVDSEKPPADLIRICQEILKHLNSGKRLGKLSTMMHKEWAELIQAARVDGQAPSRKDHFRAIIHHLEIGVARSELGRRWDRQIAPLGAPRLFELGAKPETVAREYADRIVHALSWHGDHWSRCESAIEEVGLDWNRLVKRVKEKSTSYAEMKRTLEVVSEHLESVVEARRVSLRAQKLDDQRAEWVAQLDSFSRRDKAYPLIKQFKTGIRKGNYDTYAEAWGRLRELIDLRESWERREDLLARLETGAPDWAEAMRARKEPHDRAQPPGDIERAWRYRHWEQCLTRRAGIDLDRLQQRLHRVKEDLFETTAKYVEKLSWIAQLRRTGLEQQQALNGWLGIHKKIGKGTGKNTGRLKEEAKRTLAKCRSAVPVWIMPLSRVADCFDLATARFDVIILDEASQSDVMGLIAFALAKEVVVVGDHEQVSPYAVGQKTERINALIDEILTDIPNRKLYDGKTSVYDLARQSFGGTIRLLEHFRCVPEIIQFSNQLCYGGEIRALRDASATTVKRPLVAHRVKNGEEKNGVNENEALEIVSLVSAVCRLPEYEDSTIGVISMVGTDQALYIDSVLRRRLTVSEYKKREILCGNASQFQGDERDVIFLSMVNSPSGKPLSLRQREEAKKVFNVAASRARNQLWVVHSLDPRRDLKHGDLRLQLISHAENPAGLTPQKKAPKKKFHTDFEEQIYHELAGAGYRVTPSWAVGDCEIDLVVEGDGGRRVAIQCDGDRLESVEVVVDALERQFTLERLGWDFIRLRASEYYRDPERINRRLIQRLRAAEITPTPPPESTEGATGSSGRGLDELTTRVMKRAEMIRQRWKGIPDASSITGEVEETASAESAENTD